MPNHISPNGSAGGGPSYAAFGGIRPLTRFATAMDW